MGGGTSYGDALVRAVLGPAGVTDAARREAAYRRGEELGGGEPLDEPEAVAKLVDQVATGAYAIADDDVAAAREAGASEEELFDLIVASAAGAGMARHRIGNAAVDAWEERNR
jgi:alkylhydroperoxidase family enzyme